MMRCPIMAGIPPHWNISCVDAASRRYQNEETCQEFFDSMPKEWRFQVEPEACRPLTEERE
ncbi:hypothetical protein KIN20_019016 [Parelaphostrongylus tenuis]|uniref:Uncharacterized protein n=1 Tax=Parelaphostrongylus tenuis TaxID=148309 RepID=A0AAD5QS04_PARTN|nr:hypothetical protein KIN20_019016 [Parelaphostrongylus tenuis]